MRAARIAALASVVVLGVACGTAGPVPSASVSTDVATSTTLGATPSPSASPSPQRTPQATTTQPTLSATPAQPTIFESVVYPYKLTMPAGALTRRWTAATIPWDGETPIRRESRSVDLTGTPLGSLVIFGFPATDPGVLGQRVEVNTSRFNGCKLTREPMPLEVSGNAGVSFAQLCASGTTALTVVTVKDGYGLTFRVVDYVGADQVVLDQLREWIKGATWG